MQNMHMTNKHDAPCCLCGEPVRAGEGQLFAKQGRRVGWNKQKRPEWVVQHRKCKTAAISR